jgi:hypothetical protein
VKILTELFGEGVMVARDGGFEVNFFVADFVLEFLFLAFYFNEQFVLKMFKFFEKFFQAIVHGVL